MNVDYWEKSYGKNVLQTSWHYLRFRVIRKILDKLPNGANILDVGCGSGFTIGKCLPPNKKFNIHGVDTTRELIAHAKKYRPNYHFKCGYAEKLPYKNREFDAITYLDVIEHVTDPVQSLKEAKRVLKDKGFIVIEVVKEHHPIFRIIWWFWIRTKGKVWHETHLHIFDEKSLTELIEKSGFKTTSLQKIQFGMGIIATAYKKK